MVERRVGATWNRRGGRAGGAAALVMAVVAVPMLTGCAGKAAAPPPAPVAACSVGDTAMVRDIVYFGRNRPGGGVVSDEEWRRFLDEVMTPRFPSGLTVVEATGQWRGESGVVEQERSEIVTLLHDGGQAARQSVAEVAAEYKRRFRQEAVLRERMSTCARFE
jgi:NADPH-dependent 2,4-dienoyl-CoA reductase/sulfur reductase-like enzyme